MEVRYGLFDFYTFGHLGRLVGVRLAGKSSVSELYYDKMHNGQKFGTQFPQIPILKFETILSTEIFFKL